MPSAGGQGAGGRPELRTDGKVPVMGLARTPDGQVPPLRSRAGRDHTCEVLLCWRCCVIYPHRYQRRPPVLLQWRLSLRRTDVVWYQTVRSGWWSVRSTQPASKMTPSLADGQRENHTTHKAWSDGRRMLAPPLPPSTGTQRYGRSSMVPLGVMLVAGAVGEGRDETGTVRYERSQSRSANLLAFPCCVAHFPPFASGSEWEVG